MPVGVQRVSCGDDWLEARGHLLGDGWGLCAVVSQVAGAVRVTAHCDWAGMHAEYERIRTRSFAQREGTRIRRMDAAQLLHRTVLNEHGVEFHVGGLTFDADAGTVVIDLLYVDEDGLPISGTGCSVGSLQGWEVC